MKIKLSELPLQNKVFHVKQSVKNMRKTYKLQKHFAEVSKKIDDLTNEKDAIDPKNANEEDLGTEDLARLNELNQEMMDVSFKSIDTALDYIYSILKLSEKDIETVEDNLNQNKVVDIANKIAMKLMGVSEEDVQESKK